MCDQCQMRNKPVLATTAVSKIVPHFLTSFQEEHCFK